MTVLRSLIVYALFCLWLPGAWAVAISGPAGSPVSLAGHFESFEDEGGSLRLPEVLASDDRFQKVQGFLNRGYTTSANWLRVDVLNSSEQALSRVLVLSPPTLDEVDVYVQVRDDGAHPDSYRHFSVGDHTPMAAKPLPYAQMAVPLELQPGFSHRVYIRIRSQGAQSLRAEIFTPREQLASSVRHTALQSAHLAIATALAAINFMLFLRLRDRVYLLYGSYLLTLALGDLGIENMIAVFWPARAHLLADWMTGIGTGLGFTFISLFVIAMMQTKVHHPWAHRYLGLMAGLGLAVFLASGSDWYSTLTQVLMANGPIVTLLLLWLPWRMIKRGEVATGRLVLLAFAVSAVGAAVTFLRLLGLLPVNEFTLYSLQVSSIAHMTLMMLGLAERLLTAEAVAIQSARDAELNARQLARQMTDDLVRSKAQIESALGSERHMREEQARFIDSISHEYRTPLSILKTHLDVLRARQLLEEPRLVTMGSAVQRLQDIFNNALKAHRLGRPPQPRIETIDFVSLFDEVHSEFRLDFPDCPLECQANAAACLIEGDVELLKTALRNVLDNARKYRFPSNADHPVSCRLELGPEGLALHVSNPSDPAVMLNREELFGRYVRGATRGATSGMGLGLYLVRRILHDHHGDASIVDTPSGRFEIKLTLPRLPD